MAINFYWNTTQDQSQGTLGNFFAVFRNMISDDMSVCGDEGTWPALKDNSAEYIWPVVTGGKHKS